MTWRGQNISPAGFICANLAYGPNSRVQPSSPTCARAGLRACSRIAGLEVSAGRCSDLFGPSADGLPRFGLLASLPRPISLPWPAWPGIKERRGRAVRV